MITTSSRPPSSTAVKTMFSRADSPIPRKFTSAISTTTTSATITVGSSTNADR